MTFNLDFLKVQRDYEYSIVKKLLPPRARLLEIGAGSGIQSKRFALDGFNVSAIDLASSNYVNHREFEIIEYDGKNIPFAAAEFDVIYSSSVLEHVADPSSLHKEIIRVLKPNGIIVHILPSGAWRLWTLFSGYVLGAMGTFEILNNVVQAIARRRAIDWLSVISTWRFLVKDYWLPPRHGEQGNSFSEIWYFSRFRWIKQFQKSGFLIKVYSTTGLFYTGNMLFGKMLPLLPRTYFSKIIGSACHVFVLTPK